MNTLKKMGFSNLSTLIIKCEEKQKVRVVKYL